MANEINYCYDAQFEGNILTVGRTGLDAVKPPFFRTLEKTKFLGKSRSNLGAKNTTFKGQGK